MFEAGDWCIASRSGKRPLLPCWFLVSKENRRISWIHMLLWTFLRAVRKLFKRKPAQIWSFVVLVCISVPVLQFLLVNSAEMILLCQFRGKSLLSFLHLPTRSSTIFVTLDIWADNLCLASQWKCWKFNFRSSVFNKNYYYISQLYARCDWSILAVFYCTAVPYVTDWENFPVDLWPKRE